MNLIFSFVEERQIIEIPQQNSRKSMVPDRSLSKSRKALSATGFRVFRMEIYTLGKALKSAKTLRKAALSRSLPPCSVNFSLKISMCLSFHWSRRGFASLLTSLLGRID